MQREEHRGRSKTPEYHAGDGNLPLINSFLDRLVDVQVTDNETVTGILAAYQTPRGNSAFKLVLRLPDSRMIIYRDWKAVKHSRQACQNSESLRLKT